MKPEEKRKKNVSIKSMVKTLFKKAELAIRKGSDETAARVKTAVSNIDKAVSKGIIHKNTASRKKSRLMKKLVKTKK